MESLTTKIPGYQINEYKIILVPHQDLNDRIMDVRKTFNEKFKIEKPVKSLPEIILATFKQLKMSEVKIVHRLNLIAMAMPPIKVEIQGFGSLPSHSIFLDVTSKLPISNLIKKIREDAQRLMKLDKDNTPHFKTDSYFNIAYKLQPWQYETAWLEYKDKHFTGKFIAGKMLLLRRKEGEFFYKPIENFEFLNLPIETTQGSLF